MNPLGFAYESIDYDVTLLAGKTKYKRYHSRLV